MQKTQQVSAVHPHGSIPVIYHRRQHSWMRVFVAIHLPLRGALPTRSAKHLFVKPCPNVVKSPGTNSVLQRQILFVHAKNPQEFAEIHGVKTARTHFLVAQIADVPVEIVLSSKETVNAETVFAKISVVVDQSAVPNIRDVRSFFARLIRFAATPDGTIYVQMAQTIIVLVMQLYPVEISF